MKINASGTLMILQYLVLKAFQEVFE